MQVFGVSNSGRFMESGDLWRSVVGTDTSYFMNRHNRAKRAENVNEKQRRWLCLNLAVGDGIMV